MAAPERQDHWGSGVLAPEVRGHTSQDYYARGARTLENFFISKHGSPMNRSGSQVVTNDLAFPAVNFMGRVFPFAMSATDSLLLVFGNQTVVGVQITSGSERTSWTLGGTTAGDSAGLPNLSTPWTTARLPDLKFIQNGNQLIVLSPVVSAYEIFRTEGSPDTWNIRQLLFTPPSYPQIAGSYLAGVAPNSFPDPTVTLSLSTGSQARLIKRGGERDFDSSSDTSAFPPRLWKYAVRWIVRFKQENRVFKTKATTFLSRVYDSGVGLINNTLDLGQLVNTPWVTTLENASMFILMAPKTVFNDSGAAVSTGASLGEEIAVYASQPRTIFIGWEPGYALPSSLLGEGITGWNSYGDISNGGVELLGAEVFRGRHGQFGYIGTTTGMVFRDDGRDPDFSIVPILQDDSGIADTWLSPYNGDPFTIYENDALSSTQYPLVACVFEGRLVIGAPAERQDRLWLSEIGIMHNLYEPPLKLGGTSQPFEIALSAQSGEKIVSVVSAQGLIVFTSKGVKRFAGGNEEPISVISLLVRDISGQGAATVSPVKADGDDIFYVADDVRTPMVLTPSGDSRWYVADEAAVLASHLFKNRTIVRMAYASRPHRILWVLLDNGDLRSLSWRPKQGVFGWCTHTITGATITDIAVVPESTEDALYMLVDRSTALGDVAHLERLAYREFTDIRDGVFLDCSVSWQSSAVAGETLTVTDTTAAQSKSFAGDGSTTRFLIPPDYADVAAITVTLDGAALTLTTDYTIEEGVGGAPSFVVMVTVPAVGEILAISITQDGEGRVGTSVALAIDAGSGSANEIIALLDPDGVEEPVFLQVTASWSGSSSKTGIVRNRNLPSWAYTEDLSYYRVAYSIDISNAAFALAGQSLTAVVDGHAYSIGVPTSPNISIEDLFPWGATSIHVGLPYNSDFETLDSRVAVNEQKLANEAWVELANTRGGKLGNELGSDMEDVQQIEPATAFARTPVGYLKERVRFPGSWNNTGRVAFRQSDPFPCTIVSITREVPDAGK